MFDKFNNKWAWLQDSIYHLTSIEEENVSETAAVSLRPPSQLWTYWVIQLYEEKTRVPMILPFIYNPETLLILSYLNSANVDEKGSVFMKMTNLIIKFNTVMSSSTLSHKWHNKARTKNCCCNILPAGQNVNETGSKVFLRQRFYFVFTENYYHLC